MSCLIEQSDSFWMTQRGRPFPHVATAIEEALAAYKEKEKRIKDLRVCSYSTSRVDPPPPSPLLLAFLRLKPLPVDPLDDPAGGWCRQRRRFGGVADGEHSEAQHCRQVLSRSLFSRHFQTHESELLMTRSSLGSMLEEKKRLDLHTVPF